MELVEGTARIEDVEMFLAEIGGIEDEYGVTVQAFDGRYVVGREHVERAVTLATRAMDRGEAIARDPGVEILLYAAGRRQIDRALEMGISEGGCPIVAAVVDLPADGNGGDGERAGSGIGGDGEKSGTDGKGEGVDTDEASAAAAVRDLLEPAETLSAYDEQLVCEFFGISEREREAATGEMADLVCERVALLVVDR
jgi:KEOPS complex subunit Cgi121